MTVFVNGIPKEISSGTTIAALLALLGIDRTRVAVERNHDVVPKRTYDDVVLASGDRLEVVTFVGGG
jgi:thiamine biosynthesis protein ThiS